MAQQQQSSPATQGAITQHLAKLQANGHHTPVPSVPQPPSPVKQPHKKDRSVLREWLNVLGVFLVPLMIGVYTITYNSQQSSIAEANHQADLQQQQNLAQAQQDQQQETVLITYLNNMRDLNLSQGLSTSKPNDEVRAIARAQTLTTLRQLDGIRKGIAIQFLSDAGLVTAIGNSKPIISLKDANLSNVDLSNVDLSGANLLDTNLLDTNLSGADFSTGTINLSGADLSHADLSHADLSGAYILGTNLSGADLSGANLSDANLLDANLLDANLSDAYLSGANLSGANLSGAREVTPQQLSQAKSLMGTILPDGSKHP